MMTMIENAQGCTFTVWYRSISTAQSYTLLYVGDWTEFTFTPLMFVM